MAATTPGSFQGPDAQGRVQLSGDWTLAHATRLERALAALSAREAGVQRIDAQALGKVDTAGASLLLQLAGGAGLEQFDALAPRHARLLAAVAQADAEPLPAPVREGVGDFIAGIGAAVLAIWRDALRLVSFLGLLLATLPRVLVSPQRWRVAPWVVQIHQTGLNAVPIIALLTFLVGAVVAFLGATILREFGATLYTVDLIAFSFLREFGVLLTAIMVAGRSGSAFTAQLGSMKSREEIDAIRTLGMDPVQVLVVPRALALLVSLPLLTVLAMLSGILGGAVVCALALDISPMMYFSRIHDTLEVRHFWVGMSKAPLFALMIALIGCLEGFKVAGSAESVGKHTTSSVVQSIFVVILIDALAAVFFMEMGW
ncbi:MAG: MlaE family lipid ABC transporter permease subunit [Lysobacteraceae bacterium]|uniref:ABC transporter permease n=1 Tax=Denitratimonas sp. CY0512 TaxID=3131940 RepID=UPI0030AD17BF